MCMCVCVASTERRVFLLLTDLLARATALAISACRRRHRGGAGSARKELMPQAQRTEALAASEPERPASEPQGAAVATEAEGLRLHPSSNSTGYKGVYEQSGRFQAKHMVVDEHAGTHTPPPLPGVLCELPNRGRWRRRCP